MKAMLFAAVALALAGAPAVADPLVKAEGESKVVAQNVPVADLAKAAAPADETKEAVKAALLGEDRGNALTKALEACHGDFGQFTRLQQELAREVVVEDAQQLGGFAALHNIRLGF